MMFFGLIKNVRIVFGNVKKGTTKGMEKGMGDGNRKMEGGKIKGKKWEKEGKGAGWLMGHLSLAENSA